MTTNVDKFTEKLADLELRNITADEKVQDIIDLFKMIYSGFHDLQQHIVAATDSNIAAKLQQVTADIDSKLKLQSDNITAMQS